MFYTDKNTVFSVRDVFYVSRKKEKTFYPARSFSGLSFRLNGKSEMLANGKTISANTGSVTYIPSGTDFEISTLSEEVIILHLNHFGEKEESEIKSLSFRNTERIAELFLQMHKEWQARKKGYENRCTALLYTLFEQMEKSEHSAENAETELIKNAVLYMNAHFDRVNLSVAQLAELCNISEVYFRKIFRRTHGVSPLKYINSLRLSRACRLLESGYYRAGEVSSLCGFSDAKYFSTAFKKEYGVSPAAYRKQKFDD